MGIEERFWAKVDRRGPDDCWPWTGALTVGYGTIAAGGGRGRTLYAHRISYELASGEIPTGMQVDHLCRNPRCVNPRHLEVVTQRENILRGMGATAKHAAKTECIRGHPFDLLNTYWDTRGYRCCRECRQIRQGERNRQRAKEKSK